MCDLRMCIEFGTVYLSCQLVTIVSSQARVASEARARYREELFLSTQPTQPNFPSTA